MRNTRLLLLGDASTSLVLVFHLKIVIHLDQIEQFECNNVDWWAIITTQIPTPTPPDMALMAFPNVLNAPLAALAVTLAVKPSDDDNSCLGGANKLRN